MNKALIIDLSVKQTSPAGSCVLSEIIGLSELYEVHVFSNEIDEDIKERVIFHKIETISFPLFLRYISFYFVTKYKVNNFRKNNKDIAFVQTTQGQYSNCDISYPHFCHKAYLAKYWKNSSIRGPKRLVRKINHLINKNMEAKAFKNAEIIVVPSTGLATELLDFYPEVKQKIKIISNPIAIKKFKKPQNFSDIDLRKRFSFKQKEKIITFIALGDFARKGLKLLIEALASDKLHNSDFKLLVVGGKQDEITKYMDLTNSLNIDQNVMFVGFHEDIRDFLWMADIFALPSLYEIFPLVAVQAAAAELPLLATKMHGVEEYLRDQQNGWLVERNVDSIVDVLNLISDEVYDLKQMGKNAAEAVKIYNEESFQKKWIKLYEDLPNYKVVNNISHHSNDA